MRQYFRKEIFQLLFLNARTQMLSPVDLLMANMNDNLNKRNISKNYRKIKLLKIGEIFSIEDVL
jgi:hypothetical protein